MTREQEIDYIVKRIVEGYKPLKVILFGFCAYGEVIVELILQELK